MRESLSNNHFSHEDQFRDAINHLMLTDPVVFNAFLAEHPEWERVQRLEIELDELDPEWVQWATDWLEANTEIYWEDGEPWVGRSEEDDCE